MSKYFFLFCVIFVPLSFYSQSLETRLLGTIWFTGDEILLGTETKLKAFKSDQYSTTVRFDENDQFPIHYKNPELNLICEYEIKKTGLKITAPITKLGKVTSYYSFFYRISPTPGSNGYDLIPIDSLSFNK
jgi:hypothetical protein